MSQTEKNKPYLKDHNSQVLVDGTEWALNHLGELKMPLLVLHGVEDQMVLVSGSR